MSLLQNTSGMRIKILLFFLIFLCLPASDLYPSDTKEITIYVVQRSWHTGITIATQDWINANGIVFEQLLDKKYLEIGWGDAAYYPHHGFSFWLGVRALLWPTSSTVHVHSYDFSPAQALIGDGAVALKISRADKKQLVAELSSYIVTVDGQPQFLPVSGRYGNGVFLESGAKYHIFHTCNVWTARRLRTAGIAVNPLRSITVNGLVRQLQSK